MQRAMPWGSPRPTRVLWRQMHAVSRSLALSLPPLARAFVRARSTAVLLDSADVGSLACVRTWAQQDFDEAENGQDACTFHPGGPIFHEGLKGWNCCKKRVADFDEFMAIPGCATGAQRRHRPRRR